MLLKVENLVAEFNVGGNYLRAVSSIDFTLEKGKLLCLVGESGCGKSVTAMSLMGLLPQPPARVRGTVLLEEKDLMTLSPEAWREVRGKKIGMIFQEPMTSLNPVMTAGRQVAEAIETHFPELSGPEVKRRVLELFKKVGIPEPEARFDCYPHELSGGMRQRVMIAMALSCGPSLLIADEPTTALDVTIQAQILELIASLRRELGMGVLLITHDLGVVSETADDVVVMYAGKVVERASAKTLFSNPLHPYTRALFDSIPKLEKSEKLMAIPGMVPSLGNLPSGCAFRDRCAKAQPHCADAEPNLEAKELDHFVSCFEVK